MEVKLKCTFQINLLRQASCEDYCKKLNGMQKPRMSGLFTSKNNEYYTIFCNEQGK